LLKWPAFLGPVFFLFTQLIDILVGVVKNHDRLEGVLPPDSRTIYWRGPVEMRVESVDIAEDFRLNKTLAAQLARPRTGSPLSRKLGDAVYVTEVADTHIGLLIVDGELREILQPGLHVFWRFHRNVKVEHVDLRVQVMEVQGQEILTKDKVSLRVNLTANYRVTDAVKARNELGNFVEYLYRTLQFGLRQAVGTRTLDTLLSNKGELDSVVFEYATNEIAAFGLTVNSLGLKDVILPGDMKEILNQVVEAEKAAQANIIKRREETAATRSLLNTARLMDENPTLLRLKELEMLEKVTDKVGNLTLFGGLDGVLNDMVRINVQQPSRMVAKG
jgi:regulator of protease activity HflC (stomatin/prohibitin superfamily)